MGQWEAENVRGEQFESQEDFRRRTRGENIGNASEDHTICEKAGPRTITIDLASKQGR